MRILLSIFICFLSLPAIADSENDISLENRKDLGDGTITDHFSFIVEALRDSPGSKKEATGIAKDERAAAQNPGSLKPPSASMVETETSHLLEILRSYKKQEGNAIFNRFGIKVAAAGEQTLPMVVDAKTLTSFSKLKLGSVDSRKLTCSESAKAKLSCEANYERVIRPVVDYGRKNKIVGYSWILLRGPGEKKK